MDKLTVTLKFWLEVVIVPSLRASINFREIGGKVMVVALQFLASLILVAGLGLSGTIPDIGLNITSAGLVALLFIALRIGGNIVYYPAKLYKELGGFDKEQLKLVVVPDCELSTDADSWLALTLTNHSQNEILECSVEVDEIIREGSPIYKFSRPSRFKWSSEETSRHGRQNIPAGGNRRVDLVVTHRELPSIGFQLQNPPQVPLPPAFGAVPQRYQLTIIIRGIFRDSEFVRQYTLDFQYMGGSLLVSEKNGQELEPVVITERVRATT